MKVKMPINNIVDHRKKPYRFKKINAVIEATWHDNKVKDSDFIVKNEDDEGPTYEESEHTTLADAVLWAQSFTAPVTLYIYDEDGGVYLEEQPIR